MLTTNNNINFKTVTKNLKKELSSLNFTLSHSATLNLLARSMGFENYNTYSAAIKEFNNKIDSIIETSEEGERILDDMIKNLEEINKESTIYAEQMDKIHQKTKWLELRKFLSTRGLKIPQGLKTQEEMESVLEISKWAYRFPCGDMTIRVQEWLAEEKRLGLDVPFETESEFKLWVYANFFYDYLSPFLYENKSGVRLEETLYELDENSKGSFSGLLLSDDDFFPEGLINKLPYSRMELDEALKQSLDYKHFNNIVDIHSLVNIELLFWLYETIGEESCLFHNELYNGKVLSDKELLDLEKLKYRMSSNGRVVDFYPIKEVYKNAGGRSWTITFNELFETHYIERKTSILGTIESLRKTI